MKTILGRNLYQSTAKMMSLQQQRWISIQIKKTSNPNFLKFETKDVEIMKQGSQNFSCKEAAVASKLAANIFNLEGVTNVFYGKDHISVSKDKTMNWVLLAPSIYDIIKKYLESNQPLFVDLKKADSPSKFSTPKEQKDIENQICEVIESKIQPQVKKDGGSIEFDSFDNINGIVYVRLQGACKGCPNATILLKNRIENALLYFVDEVKAVQDVSN